MSAIKIENLTFSYYGYVKPVFENVSFSYQTGMETPASSVVLKGVNLHIKKGECIVLCGKSGCGKPQCYVLSMGLHHIFTLETYREL